MSARGPKNEQLTAVTEVVEVSRSKDSVRTSEVVRRHLGPMKDARWQLGFLALFGYFIVEYMQLPLQYPVLQPLALGKVTALSALLGWFLAPKSARFVSREVANADKATVALLFATFLSAMYAKYMDIAWYGFMDIVRAAVVYFVISRLVDNPWRLRAICFIWLLLNVKIGQFVCRTYAIWHSAGVNEMDLVGHGVGGTGFFGNSADLGVAMCVIWPVAVCLLFSRPKGVYRLVLIGASTVCLGGIFLCGSRGAVVGAMAIGMATMVRNPRKLAGVAMIILLSIALWFVLPEASKQRFRSAENPYQDQTAHHRLSLWKVGIKMWEDNPIFGVGPNNYAFVRWNDYPIDISNGFMSVSHSLYIQGISELGLVGMTPMLVLWIAFFRLNSATRRTMLSLGPEQRRSFEYCLTSGLDLGFIGYLASGAFVSVLWYPHFSVLLGLSAALNRVARLKVNCVAEPSSLLAQQLSPAEANTRAMPLC